MAGLPDVEFVLFNGYDVTGIIRSISDELTNDTEEATVAGNTVATEQFVGTARGTVNATAFYDEDLSPELEGGPSGVLMYVLGGNTAGAYCECVEEAIATEYKRLIENGATHKAEIAFGAQGDVGLLDHAYIVAPLAAYAGAGDTESAYIDSGAATASGGRWWVHVTALDLDGHDDLDVQLEDSADHVTFGDVTGALATFTAIGAQMVEFDGGVDQYLAAVYSYGGAGTDPTATFAAAVTKLPD